MCFSCVRRDLLRIGVTLAGHQKKILNSIQSMHLQMSQCQTGTALAWLQGALDDGPGSLRKNYRRVSPIPSERARIETIILIWERASGEEPLSISNRPDRNRTAGTHRTSVNPSAVCLLGLHLQGKPKKRTLFVLFSSLITFTMLIQKSQWLLRFRDILHHFLQGSFVLLFFQFFVFSTINLLSSLLPTYTTCRSRYGWRCQRTSCMPASHP